MIYFRSGLVRVAGVEISSCQAHAHADGKLVASLNDLAPARDGFNEGALSHFFFGLPDRAFKAHVVVLHVIHLHILDLAFSGRSALGSASYEYLLIIPASTARCGLLRIAKANQR
jgi:hypothetical protein